MLTISGRRSHTSFKEHSAGHFEEGRAIFPGDWSYFLFSHPLYLFLCSRYQMEGKARRDVELKSTKHPKANFPCSMKEPMLMLRERQMNALYCRGVRDRATGNLEAQAPRTRWPNIAFTQHKYTSSIIQNSILGFARAVLCFPSETSSRGWVNNCIPRTEQMAEYSCPSGLKTQE